MDVENLTSWVSQPDVCRCCLSASGTWDVTASYITEGGIKEVYCDMLQECYGIALSYLTNWGSNRLVCTMCVGHLRDACSFKRTVLTADKFYAEHCASRKDNTDVTPIKVEIDQVEEEHHSPSCFADDAVPVIDDDYREKFQTEISSKYKIKSVGTDKRKRRRINLKAKRKKNKIELVDTDSDTPISELTKRKTHPEINGEDNLLKENQSNELTDRVENPNQESEIILKKRKSKVYAENYIDNRHLRSNISLILMNSTIIPFKYINNSKYICLYCDKAYLFFKELKSHITDAHHGISENDIISRLKTPKNLIKADVSDISCKVCGESFVTVEKITQHFVEKHKMPYHHTPRLKPAHGILGFDLSSESFKCHICGDEFRFFKNLSVHMNEHSANFVCHICGKKFVCEHRLQAHVVIHKSDEIKCKHCAKGFRTASAKNYHVRKVHNNANFKCAACGEVFTQYQHRLKHLVEVHRLKKPEFKCEVCLKQFVSSSGLRAHTRYSHLKNKEYPCGVCGKVFVYKWIWQRHLDAHAGTKNYGCEFCNKKFAKPYTLQVHVRIHLNDKRFVCSICKAAFVQKCSLNNHTRVHHPDAAGGLKVT